MIKGMVAPDAMNFSMTGYAMADRETPAAISGETPLILASIKEKAKRLYDELHDYDEPTYFHF
ncbi:MAG: hypothetical protein HPY65_01985 [Syntrophaceae bacterium]|nr:hypothetical protein [Syntrophaceae bacterium]